MGEVIATLVVSIPDLQSACSISGDGSARFKLDVPESEIAEVTKLIAFGRQKALRAVFYEADVQPRGATEGSGRVRRVGAV